MPTANYEQLCQRLSDLRAHLLPPQFSDTGDYADEQNDRTLGYRLLVHAEIEAFLEERARQTAIEAVKKWKNEGKVGHALTNLLAFSFRKQRALGPTDLRDEYTGRGVRLEKVVDDVLRAFFAKIENNRGLKEYHVLRLLIPLGVRPKRIDQSWLNTLNSFGVARGEVAHSSKQTQQPVDPKSESETVEVILRGLREIDETLATLT